LIKRVNRRNRRVYHRYYCGGEAKSPAAPADLRLWLKATQYSRTQERIQNCLLQLGQAPLLTGSFVFNPLRHAWIQSGRLRSHGRLTQPASNQCRECFISRLLTFPLCPSAAYGLWYEVC
jgi:hypothetical protein